MSSVEGNKFFSKISFLEKVIIDAINVIKTNKKNLKKQMAPEHLLVVGWGAARGWNREKLWDIPICFRRSPETHTTNRTRYLKTLI